MTEHTEHSGHTGATIDTLHDAFDELERRADQFRSAPAGTPRGRRRPTSLLLTVGAAAMVVGIAVVLAARFGLGPARHTAPPAPAGASHPTAPTTTVRPSPVPSVSRPPSPTAHHRPAGADLARRFAAVLRQVAGPSATFTAESPGGASTLVGQLTVHGVTGGFDLQYFRAGRGAEAMCDDTDRVHCTVSSPPSGGSLATGSEALQTAPGGITRQAVYVRPDGVEYLMHVSNAEDPKGAGTVAATPPLSTTQMVAIVTSAQW